MSVRRITLGLGFALAILNGVAATGLAADSADDSARLKKELGSADADRLIAYIRSQIPSDATTKRVAELIEQLGNANFRMREEAMHRLIETGPVALVQLRAATTSSDREVASRAQKSIDKIQQGERFDLPMAAIRQLAKLNDPRTIKLMLEYMPTVGNDSFRAEIMEALGELCLAGKTVHPAILEALNDPKLRAEAIQLLVKRNDPELRKQIKSYLTDKDPTVRFHVAMHLLKRGDRDSVPALINVIAEAPSARIWQQAEEALYALAGDLAPSVEMKSGSVEDRKSAANHWSAWWEAKGAQVLFGRADDYPTDVAAVAETGEAGRVFEWRAEGKPRFDLKRLNGPVDVRVLPGRRLLIAQQTGQQVTEYDFNGKILWQQEFEDEPVSVMRLPNGNTFVATMERVLEVRRDGEVVYSFPIDQTTSVSDANKLSDGRIAVLTTDNDLIILSPAGKEIKRLQVDSSGALEALADGHVLVSQTTTGRITEFDAKYNKVLDIKVDGAWMATHLPDGNLLVASKVKRKMIKVDRQGKIISEHDVDGQPHSLHWR
jgi:HEAT repeat protein